MQHYIIPIIAEAVSPHFLTAIRALLDFRYLAQAPVITKTMCKMIENALALFHQHKKAILDAGAQWGKNGPLRHWEIPKLEFLQSLVSNIRYNGVAIQWSADMTEHAHVEVVKDPAQSGNNQAYEPQICRYLDRLDKIANFDLATAILASGVDFHAPTDIDEEDNFDDDDEFSLPSDSQPIATMSELLTHILPHGYNASGSSRAMTNYFYRASLLQRGLLHNAPSPSRTFHTADHIVAHLSRDAPLKRMTVDEASVLYQLPDLRPALFDYLAHLPPDGFVETVGGRRIGQLNATLPFTHLEVWSKFCLQTKTYHFPHNILLPSTVNAHPPSTTWPQVHSDAVIIALDRSKKWPKGGIDG